MDVPTTESEGRQVYNLPVLSFIGSLDQEKNSLKQSTFEI